MIMPMDKLEKNIKDKLEQRELQPSDKVWASIDKAMDRPKSSNAKKRYFIYGIAAGILIILGVLGLERLKLNRTPIDNSKDLTIPSSVDQSKGKSKRETVISVNELAKRKQITSVSFDFKYNQLDEIDLAPRQIDQHRKELSKFQNSKAELLLSEVEKELQQEGLDLELQRLLDYAKSKIDKIPVNSTVYVDAASLLQDAQLEIENESLKQKFLYALEEKINQTKIALTPF
jgi:hypothetical protein